jgi:hypothetical protein
MRNTSGFVDLNAADIAVALEALSEEQIVTTCRGGRGVSPSEIERADAHRRWLAAWVRQLSSMKPGRVFFSATDMSRLRGILFTSFKSALSRRYRCAVLSDDPALLGLMRRLCEIEDFEARMRAPEPYSAVIGFDRGFPAGPASRTA